MKIIRNGIAIHNIAIDEKTTIKRRLMVENSLNLSVSVARSQPLDLKIGDYTDIANERYIIMDEPLYSLSNGVYQYDVLMRGNLHRLEVYMMPDDGRDEWFYYGTLINQIDKVMAALNSKEGGWSVEHPDLTKISDHSAKNINYANISILSAFHAICSKESGWDLEFDIVGKVVKFAKEIKTPTELSFEYGRGGGLYKLSRGQMSGEKIGTRVTGYGGKANMPNAQRLSFASINGGKSYIDRNVDLYGLRESRVNFDHIFPRRNGAITSKATQVEVGKANWTVVDTTLDFDLKKQVLENSVIMFNTGDCVGVEFSIVDYNHGTKTITFKENVDDSGFESYVLPNASRLPKAGDEYVLINILMPDSYIEAAKRELKTATENEASRVAIPQRSYSVVCDPRYFKALGYTPYVGDSARIIDAPHKVNYVSRIIEINYPVIYPTKIDMVLADKIPIPANVVMSKSIKEIKTQMAMLDRGNITESYLRQIFHPLGGNANIDLTAKDVYARDLSARDINAVVARLQNMFASGEVGSAEFVSGLLGTGWNIDAKGNAEMNSLILRTFLQTPELIKNQVRVIGTQAWLTECGTVDTIIANPRFRLNVCDQHGQRLIAQYSGKWFVKFHEEGANGWFRKDDILLGIYNYDNGFETIYLRVEHSINGGYLISSINGLAPAKEMILARQGNFTDPSRQGSVYFDSAAGYIRILGEVNSPEIALRNIKMQSGNLRGLRVMGVDNMPDDGLFAPGLAIISSQVAGLDTKLVVLGDQISSKVSKDGIVSSINQSAEAIKIAARLIELTGDVKITQAFINALTVNSLDTRIPGKGGVILQRGMDAIVIYDASGNEVGRIGTWEDVSEYAVGLFLSQGRDAVLINGGGLALSSQHGSVVLDTTGMTNGNDVIFSRYIAKLPPTAKIDMPGVLAAGRVDGTYCNVSSQMGVLPVWVARIPGAPTGRYRIIHERFAAGAKHWITATLYGMTQASLSIRIEAETDAYTDIRVYDASNLYSTVNCDFNFMIYGENRWDN